MTSRRCAASRSRASASERRACQANGQPGVLPGHRVPGARGDHEQVRRDRRRGREVPDAVGRRGRPAVAEHRPVLGGRDGEGHRRLEVGLVEAGEHPLREVAAAERGEVRRAVGRVDVPVHPVAAGDAGERRLDHQLVVREQVVQPDPVALGGGRRAPAAPFRVAAQVWASASSTNVEEPGAEQVKRTTLREVNVAASEIVSATSYDATSRSAARRTASSRVRDRLVTWRP